MASAAIPPAAIPPITLRIGREQVTYTTGVSFSDARIKYGQIRGGVRSVDEIIGGTSTYRQGVAGAYIDGTIAGVTAPVSDDCNGFVSAIIAAYNSHHHLVLRADDIWQAILGQFNLYVLAHAEELRGKFVNFEGKKELEVHADTWPISFDALIEAMRGEIKKALVDESVTEWLLPAFSTTRDNDRVVASATMMSVFQKYFDYKMCLMCGLPKVTLLGQVDDYHLLLAKIERLREYEVPSAAGQLVHWVELLRPIVAEMINCFSGAVNYEFWSHVCHFRHFGSGSSYLSGWITAFCIFGENGKYRGDKIEDKSWKAVGYGKYPLLDASDIVSGVANCPVTIDNNGQEFKTMLFAGQIVMQQFKTVDNTVDTLASCSDWAMYMVDESKFETNRRGW